MIDVQGLLKVGVGHPPGDDPKLRTVLELHAQSRLVIEGRVILFPGTRVTLYPGARLQIGDRTFLNAESKLYVWDSVIIGSHCAIAWNVTIMELP
jgi:acetyltransferase-like isoleucine patch superfamily enzyme